MGTRSSYKIIEKWHEPNSKTSTATICVIYVQFDGYPEGHPLDTAKFLASGKVVNGIPCEEGLYFNGAGCMAASLIAEMKKKPGGWYLSSPSNYGKSWEDYLYEIIVDMTTKSIQYICRNHKKKILFKGTPEQFIAWATDDNEK